MKNYYLTRVISAIITLFIVTTITFFMMHAIPGGPFTREKAVPAEIEAILNEKYHLDDPILVQYLDYMKGVITLDLGPSFKELGFTVNDLIILGFPASMKIGLLAVLLIVIVGIPIGIISALKQNKFIDHAAMFFATLGVTIPSFIVATLYITIVAANFSWIPISGLGTFREVGIKAIFSYIGPVIALSGYSISFVSRLTRSSMLEVLRQDYIRTARANGLSERKVIWKHALKNALIPVVTYIGPMTAAILTGSFVIEKIFVIPGIGRYFVESVSNRDYTVIIGMTVFYAALYIVMVLLVDVAYAFIDPRIRLGKKLGD
ncbi:MAG: ABC transporter permease [Bacilli bacterium]|nr:ABC transporter permease [Bacilli bacterium]